MASLNGKSKLTKSDAETIAVGQQISGELGNRLCSESGKSYTVGINIQPGEMGTIQEVIEAGGIDHAEGMHTQTNEKGKCCNQGEQIIALINNLQRSMDDMNQKISSSTQFQKSAENRLQKIEQKQDKDSKQIHHVEELAQQSQLKIDILTDIVIRQHCEIENLKGNVVDIQTRSMMKNITISGIPESEKENCVRKVNQFIAEKLLITDKMIPIENAYRFGVGANRPMLVMLRHAADKSTIFEHVKNLKGQKVNGVQCFVSSQLPEVANENKRFVNNAMFLNKKQPASCKLPLTVKYGQLHYKGKPLEKKVRPPTPFDMLSMMDPEIDALNDLQFSKGVHEEEQESMFHGYTISVTNHTEINQAYKSLRLKHGQATYISCAYKLRSVPPLYNEGGCDDNEHGASRSMLPLLQEANMENVAVFVVRHFGGIKLGPKRFDIIRKVAASALTGWQVDTRSVPDQQNNGWGDEPLDHEHEGEETD